MLPGPAPGTVGLLAPAPGGSVFVVAARKHREAEYRSMMLLPKKVGPFTLVRKLGAGGIAESYEGVNQADGKQVLIRRILPYIVRDPSRLASAEARVYDLLGVQHPFLVKVLDWIEDGDERYIVEEWVDGVDLDRLLTWCRTNDRDLPHNILLHIATQVCTGLEALHGRPGRGSGADNVLHLALRPGAIFVRRNGKVVVGGYGLVRSPTALPHGGVTAPVPTRMEYLSPEQTHSDQKLSPASDIFALGAVLYELLTRRPLFRSDSNLQTIHRIRRAEITTELLQVQEAMPGLDRVLYRALSLNPRHRYQRAFVLREDLRGLMANYSFSTIGEEVREFIAPMLREVAPPASAAPASPANAPDAPSDADAFDDLPPTRIDPDPMSTAAHVGQALAERALREQRRRRESARTAEDQPSLRPSPTLAPEDEPAGAAAGDRPTLPFGDEPDLPTHVGTQDLATDEVPEPTEGLDKTEGAPPPAPAIPPAPDLSQYTRSGPSASSLDDVDPNSTRGFLRGHAPETPKPPPAEPPPRDRLERVPGFGRPVPPPRKRSDDEKLEEVPGFARKVPPPASRASEKPPVYTAAASAPPEPAPTAGQPEPPRSEPVATPRPAPATEPGPAQAQATPTQVQMDDDFDWRPHRKRNLLVGLAALAVVLVVGCAGGLYALLARLTSGEGHHASPLASAQPTPTPASPTPSGTTAAEAALAEAPAPPEQASPSEAAPTAERPETSPRTDHLKTPRPASASREPEPATSRRAQPASSYRSRSARTSTPTNDEVAHSAADEAIVDASLDVPRDMGAIESSATDLDRYAAQARRGGLTSSDVLALEMIDVSDPNFTRSRALLLEDAEQKGNSEATKKYLDDLMMLPENRYNPIYLSELARWQVNHKQYRQALDNANKAERYWARLPSALVFSKKSEVYEIQAKAYQGLFYQSEDNLELLDQAIRHWRKYRNHVRTRSRTDLAHRADSELAKLEDIQRRLQ